MSSGKRAVSCRCTAGSRGYILGHQRRNRSFPARISLPLGERRTLVSHARAAFGCCPGEPGDFAYKQTAQKHAERAEAEARMNAAKVAQLEEGLRWFERVFGSGVMLVTAQSFGFGTVRENHPEFFRE